MSNLADLQYLRYMEALLKVGDARMTRNGVRHTLFGAQMGFDLNEGFPILTTKQVNFKAIATELCWFLKGETNTKYLTDRNIHIWDEWADEKGDLGPVYGSQWRSWPAYQKGVMGNVAHIDQIDNVFRSLRDNPMGTRHIVTAWNPGEVDNMALPPCHAFFQFDVTSDGKLNLQLYQRSADWFLGVPFNIASYALLLHIFAFKLGLQAGTFVHTFGNYHLYDNHREQAHIQIRRVSKNLPMLVLSSSVVDASWDDLEPEMFALHGYDPHPAIKAPISA